MQKEEIIKTTIEDLLSKMGFGGKVTIEPSGEEDSFVCEIDTEKDESNFLIGQHGANLQALQHLARLLVRKKIEDKIKFSIDINKYKSYKNESVLRMAQDAAMQALEEKRAVVLRPMSNYERRLVHMELSKNSKIVTESIGEGENRKVVIKPSSTI